MVQLGRQEVSIKGTIYNLSPCGLHGFHYHAKGDVRQNATCHGPKKGLKLLKKFKDIRILPRSELGRVKSLVRTQDLSDDECKRHFTSITGEEAAQILELAAAPGNGENLKKLLHVTVILVNEIGQPAGEDLRHDSGDEDPPRKKKKKNQDLVQRVADLEKSKEDSIKELTDKSQAGVDDLGRGGDAGTLKTVNADGGVGNCCQIKAA
ncbi:SOD1 [Mytilus coruscus]|uniref:SOD1 n=1 Tax=Mytilus coruscus TaxID=42192 RepID=A0A6J8BT86_MYTCO|nr:SOD1 [Mytilus coruscus]